LSTLLINCSPFVLETLPLTLDGENVRTCILITICLKNGIDSSLLLVQIHVDVESFILLASWTWASRSSTITPFTSILTFSVISLLHWCLLIAMFTIIHILCINFLSIFLVRTRIHSWLIRVTISFTVTHRFVIIFLFLPRTIVILLVCFGRFWHYLKLLLLRRFSLIRLHFAYINASILSNQLCDSTRI